MISKNDLKRISEYIWEIPTSYSKFMRVPARVYVSEKMLEQVEPKALEQLINVASLPGIIKYSLAMPDIHTGYGFVIGGIAATKLPEGVISPGGIGFDQNCGVRLLTTDFNKMEIDPYIDNLIEEMQRQVPSGLGKGRKTKFSTSEVNKILEQGVSYLIKQGYGEQDDIEKCEEGGRMEQANADCVSDRAKNRGRDQVGTLGSGNHFLEIQVVESIFDESIAQVFGLHKGQIVIMIHTGSRGLGHQNCTDYLKVAGRAMNKYNISLPDRQLACMPFDSPEGKRFFSAMGCACNFAWCNRQAITHYVRQAWATVLGKKTPLSLIYDVSHNIAKVEEHQIDGKKMKLLVHRKGATRAFPPEHPDLPECYQKTGQPVLVPGTMGTASYVLAGIKESKDTFYSICHGAGRIMSRTKAKKRISGAELVASLKNKGILVKSYSIRGIAEEAPLAYKDIDSVVEVVHNAKLAKKVAKLRPLAVIKGE